MAAAPRLVCSAAGAPSSAASPSTTTAASPAGRAVRPAGAHPASFGPRRQRPMLALGTSPAAARTPIVLDVPDLAALQLATGQEAVWHGRTHVVAESDPSRLFTVSSSRGTVEVVVLTRAERAARDLVVLDALEATLAAAGTEAHRADPADVVTEIATRPRHGAPRREDGGMADAA